MGRSYGDIQNRGLDYSHRVDRGEAYTHATAVCLGQPAVSNDWNAIKVLAKAGYQLPSPVLRAFDLVVFAHQTAIMSEADCDKVRKILLREKEFIPAALRAASFRQGVAQFAPRLVDASAPPVGAAPTAGASFSRQLVLTKT